jgi:5'-nucleotidase
MGILLTNDDGVDAPGLAALWKTLSRIDRVMVAAPRFEQSGVGHALSLSAPVPVRPLKMMEGWAIQGSPADCVRICVKALTREPIDMVVSGINFGSNVGILALYSGTVAAALEAVMLGLTGVAVSVAISDHPDYGYAAELAEQVVRRILIGKLPRGIAYSLNLPARPRSEIRGLRITRQSRSVLLDGYVKREDPRGNVYFWLKSGKLAEEDDSGSDLAALRGGYATLTPMHVNLTDEKSYRDLLSRDPFRDMKV